MVLFFSQERVGGDGVEEDFWAWDPLMGQLWPQPCTQGLPHAPIHAHIPGSGSPEQVEVNGQGLRVAGGRDGASLTKPYPGAPLHTFEYPGTTQAQVGLRLVS